MMLWNVLTTLGWVYSFVYSIISLWRDCEVMSDQASDLIIINTHEIILRVCSNLWTALRTSHMLNQIGSSAAPQEWQQTWGPQDGLESSSKRTLHHCIRLHSEVMENGLMARRCWPLGPLGYKKHGKLWCSIWQENTDSWVFRSIAALGIALLASFFFTDSWSRHVKLSMMLSF